MCGQTQGGAGAVSGGGFHGEGGQVCTLVLCSVRGRGTWDRTACYSGTEEHYKHKDAHMFVCVCVCVRKGAYAHVCSTRMCVPMCMWTCTHYEGLCVDLPVCMIRLEGGLRSEGSDFNQLVMGKH